MHSQPQAETRKTWFALLALLGLTLLLRLSANLEYPLWNDEIWRATLILDPGFWHAYFAAPTVETAITAPVYALLVKFAAWFQVSPVILRLTSLVPGVLCVPGAFALIRRAGGSVALAALAGLFFAINPNFVHAAKEMKPYSLEVCLHLACVYAWLALVTAAKPAQRDWTIFFCVVTVAVFSTPTTIFLLPAAGTSLFVRFAAEKNLSGIKICIAGFTALAVLVLGLYVLEWRYGASDGMLAFWADGFLQPGQNYAHFLAAQYYGVWHAAFQTSVAVPHQALLALMAFVIVLIWAAASGALRRGPLREFALFGVLLAVTLYALNALRLWPLGPGRENLFLMAHIIILFFLFLTRFPLSRPLAPLAWAGAFLAVLWPLHSAAGRAHYGELIGRLGSNGVPLENADRVIADFSYGGAIGKTIAAHCTGPKTLLLLDGYMTAASLYYRRYDAAHRQGAALLDSSCVQVRYFGEAHIDPAKTRATLAQALAGAPDAWLLYTNLDGNDLATLRAMAGRFGQIAQAKDYANAGYFRLIIRK